MNLRRVTYVQRFGLTLRQACDLDVQFLNQLDACKEDAARRLLLGVSEKIRENNTSSPPVNEMRRVA
jgi:hypothetical protein